MASIIYKFKGRPWEQKWLHTYANIFMGRAGKTSATVSKGLKPFSWLRFIDDIDMKWTHGRETLEAFLKTANSFHSPIRFTAEVSNDKHVFLDTMSHLVDDKVAVDLYTKPTDSHQVIFCPQVATLLTVSKNIPI